jgi:cytidine deaminase
MSAEIPWEQLFEAARKVRERAHAPYSRFSVVTGCNVENSSYGLSVCAERGALAAGVAQGRVKPVAVAIVVDTPTPCPPCGMCRQVMLEFAPRELPVRSRNLKGDEARYSLGELLPHAFTSDFL